MARARPDVEKGPIDVLAQAKWRSSGLTDEQASTLKLKPLTGPEVAALAPNFAPTGAVQIPYFDFTGKITSFYRLRYLEPLPGFAGIVEKPQRYVQPAKTLNEVYLPPLLPASWKDIAEDISVPIYITEGEFKAAAGSANGLACLGLGGVDVWRATKRGVGLLPQLAKIKWKGREVVIVFDSDAASNPNVVRAQRQLAQELLTHGALPSVASLPPRKDGGKQGLDDLLVAEGPQALLKIMAEAPAFPEAEALWAMNEDVVYVKDPGFVIERSTGRRMEPNKFVNHHYSNRHYVETQATKAGGVVAKKKPLARRWLDWEARYECDRILYKPGQPRVYTAKDGAVCWNAWKGWGVEPKKGDVSVWKWLLDWTFKDEPAARTWFERWCAYPLQHPGAKLFTASLMWSVQHGVGKGLIAYMLGRIYGDNFIEIGNQELSAGFNAWSEHRQLVLGDEVTAGEARLDKDKLKRLITRPKITINQKFMPEYVIDDCINYLFNSQAPDALFVEDNDRRFFIHEVKGKAEQKFYEQCDAFLHGTGPAHLFHHLLSLDLGDFQPKAPALVTGSKLQMISAGKSALGLWCEQLREDPLAALRPIMGHVGEAALKECDIFTPRALLHAYDPEGVHKGRVTEATMGRELIKAGFRQLNGGSPIRTKLGVMRLYAIRNVQEWADASPKKVSTHYEKFFSGPGKF